MKKNIFTIVALLIIGVSLGALYYKDYVLFYWREYTNKEVHVHADFLFYVNGKKIDLTGEQYQSTDTHKKHDYIHFHDGNDDVIHRHADGITFVEFMQSIGFTLSDTCLTMDSGEKYCTTGENVLRLYVNGKPETHITQYVTEEEDKILLYYGSPTSPDIQTYLSSITEETCMYSETCPEKGKPPTESCGLTCDVTQRP